MIDPDVPAACLFLVALLDADHDAGGRVLDTADLYRLLGGVAQVALAFARLHCDDDRDRVRQALQLLPYEREMA